MAAVHSKRSSRRYRRRMEVWSQSAEAIACDEVTDHSYYVSSWLDEVVRNREATVARKQGLRP